MEFDTTCLCDERMIFGISEKKFGSYLARKGAQGLEQVYYKPDVSLLANQIY